MLYFDIPIFHNPPNFAKTSILRKIGWEIRKIRWEIRKIRWEIRKIGWEPFCEKFAKS